MHVKCDYRTISSLRSLRAEGGGGRGWRPEMERRPVATRSCIVDEVILLRPCSSWRGMLWPMAGV